MLSGKEVRIIALLALDTVFFLLELIIGYMSHSLALIADSFHMLNDIFSLVVALWAVNVSKYRNPDAKYTYGWKRAEILGALVNAVFLIALCFSISIEALQRLLQPQEIENPRLVLYVGLSGLLSNIVGLVLFHDHSHSHSHSHSHAEHSFPDSGQSSESINQMLPDTVVTEDTSLLHTKNNTHRGGSLNMHGVFLHVLGDALGNIGVMASALFIWKTTYSWRFYSDPLVSLVITIIIFSSALPLSFKASKILLQATPSTVSADEIQKQILDIPGVLSVHDFHIWNLTESFYIASVHVQIDSTPDMFSAVAKLIRDIFHSHNIHSATVQPEFVNRDVSAETRRRFSIMAGGNSSNADQTMLDPETTTSTMTTAYGATTAETNCLVDEAANCNADNCLK